MSKAIREEMQKIIDSLPEMEKKLTLEALLKTTLIENPEEMERYVFSLPPNIARAIAKIHMLKLKGMVDEESDKELKQKSIPVREDALQILLSLIESGSKDNDIRLVERATAMAIALHDKF